MLRIGELAERSGLSRDAIRFYERLGLLQSHRGPEGRYGYRRYPSSALRRLSLIHQGKSLGFTLAELQELLSAWADHSLPAATKRAVITDKIASVDQKIASLQALSQELRQALAGIREHCEPGPAEPASPR